MPFLASSTIGSPPTTPAKMLLVTCSDATSSSDKMPGGGPKLAGGAATSTRGVVGASVGGALLPPASGEAGEWLSPHAVVTSTNRTNKRFIDDSNRKTRRSYGREVESPADRRAPSGLR